MPGEYKGASHVVVNVVSPPALPDAETTGLRGADGTGINACAGIAVLEIATAARIAVSARRHVARGWPVIARKVDLIKVPPRIGTLELDP